MAYNDIPFFPSSKIGTSAEDAVTKEELDAAVESAMQTLNNDIEIVKTSAESIQKLDGEVLTLQQNYTTLSNNITETVEKVEKFEADLTDVHAKIDDLESTVIQDNDTDVNFSSSLFS